MDFDDFDNGAENTVQDENTHINTAGQSDDDPFGGPVESAGTSSHESQGNGGFMFGGSSEDDGMVMGSTTTNGFGDGGYEAEKTTYEDTADDSKYQEYERKLREEIAAKDNSEYDAINDMRTSARDSLEKILADRNARIEAKKKANRDAEQLLKKETEAVLSGKNAWVGAVGLVNLQSKDAGRDNSRMKAILIKMKNAAA